MRQTIKDLKQQIVEKERIISNLRDQIDRKDDKDDGNGLERDTLEALEE